MSPSDAESDTRGYLPYLRTLILLQCNDLNKCWEKSLAAVLDHAGFTVDEIAELLHMKRPAVAKAISRARKNHDRRPTRAGVVAGLVSHPNEAAVRDP